MWMAVSPAASVLAGFRVVLGDPFAAALTMRPRLLERSIKPLSVPSERMATPISFRRVRPRSSAAERHSGGPEFWYQGGSVRAADFRRGLADDDYNRVKNALKATNNA
jgi:hypothetical protein